MAGLAKRIDHTALGSDLSANGVMRLCQEAKEHGFRSVFLQPCRVRLAADLLKGTGIAVGTVAGFPFGANFSEVKAREAALAVSLGAAEIDMVINVGWIKDGRWEDVRKDIGLVVKAAAEASDGGRAIVKVIIETCLLSDSEKRRAAIVIKEVGADYVKTSTGYMGAGANADDVRLLRAVVGDDFGVKASGGIRTLAQATDLVEAGADIIGTSAGVAIIEEAS